MTDYGVFYERIERYLSRHPRLALAILRYNRLITRLMYLLYPLLLVYLYYRRQYQDFWRTFWIPAVAFILLSLYRSYRNQPRPYETWHTRPLMKRDGSGKSFPSRHVFSASLISMCFLRQHLWFGIVLLLLTVGLALCRVIGGVHYPKDVLVGYVLGVLCGLFLFG